MWFSFTCTKNTHHLHRIMLPLNSLIVVDRRHLPPFIFILFSCLLRICCSFSLTCIFVVESESIRVFILFFSAQLSLDNRVTAFLLSHFFHIYFAIHFRYDCLCYVGEMAIVPANCCSTCTDTKYSTLLPTSLHYGIWMGGKTLSVTYSYTQHPQSVPLLRFIFIVRRVRVG